jgi:hypothetical protein
MPSSQSKKALSYRNVVRGMSMCTTNDVEAVPYCVVVNSKWRPKLLILLKATQENEILKTSNDEGP